MNRKVILPLFVMFFALSIASDTNAQRKHGRGDRMKQRRQDNAPKVGDSAPTFSLKSHDGKSETTLADYKGEKPVVLFFGSYT